MAQISLSSSKRTFRVHSLVRWLATPAIACAVIVAIIYFVSEPRDRVILPWMILILGIALGFVALLLYMVRLEISPDGILYGLPGIRVRTAWDNIEGYAFRSSASGQYTALVMRQPAQISGWLTPLMGFSAAMPTIEGMRARRGIGEMEKAIPISMFAADWRDGELGSLIRQYAPAAFDNLVS
ncbi:MAG: hypothetical protein IT323_02790 [Anaerolineae bacterium]|nr:hypothetical protein [Anaerolineae bacterium]